MSEPTSFTLEQLRDAAGTDLGASRWFQIDQSRIDAFADATEDHQWIHVDPARAADGPYGTTIAHGYLTLSLLPTLMVDLIQITGVSARLNYGLNKLRFPAPVSVGKRIRARAEIVGAEDVTGGVQAAIAVTIEVEGESKPACVAEYVFRALA